MVAGCSDQGTKPDVSRGPGPSVPALYGPPTGATSSSIPRTRPFDLKNDDWKKAPFAVVQTELSPVTLFHATTHELSLFTQMPETGLGAPTFASFGQIGGPIIVTNGLPMEATTMTENWILVWFAGAGGWTNWDSPWLVCLQHKPRAAQLNTNGLHLEFDGEAGYVAMMPLYGYDKPPQQNREFLSAHGLTERKVKTWTWIESIPREVLYRVRYWSEAMREFPLYCEDSFSVDRSRDAVTIRQKFHWLSIDDDWKTKHRKLAPISPPLGLVSLDKKFPVEFSKKPFDMDLATPYGPYLCIEDVDSYDVTLRVLQYVNETEASDPPNTSAHPSVAAALKKLNQTAANKFKRGDQYEYDHGGLNNFCWAIQGDGWYAKALPYYNGPIRTNALASLRKYFHEDVLVTNRFIAREFPKGSGHEYLILEGPGIGSWGVLGDAGKFSANLLETLWAYAHYTGDWDLVKERWPMIKKMFCTPAETRWVGFGRDAIAEMGDEAAPCAAFARLAYHVGDMDSYNYACNIFARELVHHYLKQRGADYFRKHQPWHSMEFMDEEVYLTNLWGDTAGWQIDGPKYPE